MKTRLSKVLACLFAGILTATAADYSVFAAEETPEIEYYVCPNSKILKEDETDYSEMTANGALLFSAAANERESAQIILTKEGKYENFTLKLAGDLECIENGHTISSDNFEVFFEHYVKVEGYWELTGSGSYPDALIPYYLATDSDIPEGKRANNFTIDENKKNQGLWFTINIPAETPVGTYTGKLVGSIEVPVEVKVFDFVLPTLASSCTAFSVKPRMAEGSTIEKSIGINTMHDYQKVVSGLLQERKISSGYMQAEFNENSNLKADVDELYKFIVDSKTTTPYYNIGIMSGVYRDQPGPIRLNCKQSADNIVDEFKIKSGIALDEDSIAILKGAIPEPLFSKEDIVERLRKAKDDKEIASNLADLLAPKDIKFDCTKSDDEIVSQFITQSGINMDENSTAILKKAIPNSDFIQDKITKNLRDYDKSTEGKEIASFFEYLLGTSPRINQYPRKTGENGLEDLLKAIIDKSCEESFDMLQYAYIQIPCVDEPQLYSFRDNISPLVNSQIVDNTIKEVKKYIDNQEIDSQLKDKLEESLENVIMTVTRAPDEKSGQWRSILSAGLKTKTNTQVWKYYTEYAKKTFGDDSGKSFIEVYKNTEHPSVTVQLDYHMHGMDAPFHDFSSNSATNTNTQGLLDSLNTYQEDQQIKIWWYSCNQSGKNASIPGYMINCNQGKYYEYKDSEKPIELNLNPLAVARANKWQQYNLGISGETYWGVDVYLMHSEIKNDKGKLEKGERIFKDDIGITARGEDWSASDAMLIYPIKELLKNVYGITNENTLNSLAAKYGYFCSSIRLENIGEANDDYDYLCLAEQMVESYPNHPEYRERLNSIIEMLIEPGIVDYTNPKLTNSTNLARARTMLVALIEGRFNNLREVSNGKNSNTFTAVDGVPRVNKWKSSDMVLCFDVFETTTYQDSNHERSATVSLMDDAGNRLNDLITIDFKSREVRNCKGAALVPKYNGWYTVQIPLKQVPLNEVTSGKVADGTETLSKVGFKKEYIYRSFYVDNFKCVKEVSKDSASHTFTVDDGVPEVRKWKTNDTVLCFDVYETNIDQHINGERSATVSLADRDWNRLNDLITIDFKSREIRNCTGAAFVSKGNGWYTVQIPLKQVLLNKNTSGKVADGTETLSKVVFIKDYINNCSFLVDNFKAVREVSKDSATHTFTSFDDGVPCVKNWKTSDTLLCFDVYETTIDKNGIDVRSATVSLADSNTTRLNDLITIDFKSPKITGCTDAVLVSKGNGWYTVQIPLKHVPVNKEKANGTETLTKVCFIKGNIKNCSFLVDNFKIESVKGNGDLNGDGVVNELDVAPIDNHLTTKGAPPQNAWDADLDHNGILNAVDKTLLKRQLLTQ